MLVARVSRLTSGSQPQDDLQSQCPQEDSWEASITDRKAACLVIFPPIAVCLSCTPRSWRTCEEGLNDLFAADHDGPVFSILLDRQVVSFLWLINLNLYVCMAEGRPNRGQSTSEVSH